MRILRKNRSIFFYLKGKVGHLSLESPPLNYREENEFRDINFSVYKTPICKFYIFGEVLSNSSEKSLVSLQGFMKTNPRRYTIQKTKITNLKGTPLML